MTPILLAVLSILVLMLAAYTLMEWRAAGKKTSGGERPRPMPPDRLPMVSALLPVYNEKLVVKRLLKAAGALEYPPELFEILVLDDSTDECSALIAEMTEKIRGQGLNIRHLRRDSRIGYKAGNLAFGLERARGELIAIFDADCRPHPSFLKKTIPFFSDSRLGFLQTEIARDNAGRSFLTRFQAMEASHKDDVSLGLALDRRMASLTGSACVWRRACIDAIGGVSADTITEDVDMGYAAQLSDWRCLHVPEPLANEEFPETMASFRVQRQRWARGLIQNAIRHAGGIFSAPMSLGAKASAISLAFSPMLLALFYIILLLAPLFAVNTHSLGSYFDFLCLAFLITASFWGWINTSGGSGEKAGAARPFAKIKDLAGYILMFFPISLYYLSAAVQLAAGKGKAFHSTPKGSGRKRVPHPRINRILLLLEAFSLAWSLMTIFLALRHENYWVLLYAGLCAAGFSLSLAISALDLLQAAPPPSHILLTGAAGSIGSALVREYAAPGVHFTLPGRNIEKLKKLAEECEAKGGSADIISLDLADTEAARNFSAKLAASNPPDLIIANAGLNTNIGADGKGEPWEEVKELLQVNILSSLAIIYAALPAMRRKKSGQIAILSSLAAYYGLPATPAYCASKAALRNWGASLRGWLSREGIRVNVILPGYVDSPMCRAMPGPKPFLWTPERAAKKIRKGLERDQARISFPFPLNLGVWLLSLLPARLAMPIAKMLGYGI